MVHFPSMPHPNDVHKYYVLFKGELNTIVINDAYLGTTNKPCEIL